MDQNREAFIDGKNAFKAGERRSTNPHPVGTREHSEWLGGWLTEKAFKEFDLGETG